MGGFGVQGGGLWLQVAGAFLIVGVDVAAPRRGGLQLGAESARASFHAFQGHARRHGAQPRRQSLQGLQRSHQPQGEVRRRCHSAASDSCARCHPDGATTDASVGSVNLTRKYGDSKVTFGGELSKERFNTATTGLSVSRDLNKSNHHGCRWLRSPSTSRSYTRATIRKRSSPSTVTCRCRSPWTSGR